MHKLFTVCTEHVRSPYTEHAASGLPNLTPLEGEVRFVQAQDRLCLSSITDKLYILKATVPLEKSLTFSRNETKLRDNLEFNLIYPPRFNFELLLIPVR